MLTAAARDGYAGATVSRVIANAGVSRPTFYDYFPDREACFLAVNSSLAARVHERVRSALRSCKPERAVESAVCAMVAMAEQAPLEARFLCDETLAAGERTLDARDAAIAQIAKEIDDTIARAAGATFVPDLPTIALVGGLQRSLAASLRNSQAPQASLALELSELISNFERPRDEHRWKDLKPGRTPEPSSCTVELSISSRRSIPRGRSSATSAEIAHIQRERIVFATAKTAAEKGYHAATVSDITAAAGVDRRVFYAHFKDKQQAFLATYEFAFRHAMGVAASAYFGAETWPKRIWQGIRAMTQFYDDLPVFGHIGFIDSHAVGPSAIQRIDDHRMAFTVFLQEGNQYAKRSLTRPTMETIGSVIFEIGYLHARARKGREWKLSGLTAHAAYMALAPFIGAEAADQEIDSQQQPGS